MEEKAVKAEEERPAPEKPAGKKVTLRFVGQLNHGSDVGRLTCGDVVLERGEAVEVEPEVARGILEAFAGRYEIEEVR